MPGTKHARRHGERQGDRKLLFPASMASEVKEGLSPGFGVCRCARKALEQLACLLLPIRRLSLSGQPGRRRFVCRLESERRLEESTGGVQLCLGVGEVWIAKQLTLDGPQRNGGRKSGRTVESAPRMLPERAWIARGLEGHDLQSLRGRLVQIGLADLVEEVGEHAAVLVDGSLEEPSEVADVRTGFDGVDGCASCGHAGGNLASHDEEGSAVRAAAGVRCQRLLLHPAAGIEEAPKAERHALACAQFELRAVQPDPSGRTVLR